MVSPLVRSLGVGPSDAACSHTRGWGDCLVGRVLSAEGRGAQEGLRGCVALGPAPAALWSGTQRKWKDRVPCSMPGGGRVASMGSPAVAPPDPTGR